MTIKEYQVRQADKDFQVLINQIFSFSFLWYALICPAELHMPSCTTATTWSGESHDSMPAHSQLCQMCLSCILSLLRLTANYIYQYLQARVQCLVSVPPNTFEILHAQPQAKAGARLGGYA